ncbi:MAG: hypothetical protein ACLFVT_06740 [Syntrophobacteria bacterium]
MTPKRLFVVTLAVYSLSLVAPGPALAETLQDSHLEAIVADDGKREGAFFGTEAGSEARRNEGSCASSGRTGYWFRAMPWLGFEVESAAGTMNGEDRGTSLEGETSKPSMCGYFIFRYPKGRVQPYLGIGTTLLVDDVDTETNGPHQFLLGVSWSF